MQAEGTTDGRMTRACRPLTEKQYRVLVFIQNHTAEFGYPPTIREIGAHIGVRSLNGVNDHTKSLEKKGYVVRAEMKSRGLRLTEKAVVELGAPVVPHVSRDGDRDAQILRLAEHVGRLAAQSRAAGWPSPELLAARRALIAVAEAS